jgi:hypothetical protein
VWLRELSEEPEPAPVPVPIIILDEDVLKKYTGTYQENERNKFKIIFEHGKMFINIQGGRKFELVPHSKEKFSVKSTAIDLMFKLNKEGVPTEVEYHFTGSKRKFKKVD